MLKIIVTTIHVSQALALIGLVLLHSGKGGGLSEIRWATANSNIDKKGTYATWSLSTACGLSCAHMHMHTMYDALPRHHGQGSPAPTDTAASTATVDARARAPHAQVPKCLATRLMGGPFTARNERLVASSALRPTSSHAQARKSAQ